ncbi:MAG TPA: DUF2786 domain-containing protein [Rhodospirillales bacterium]|nr:DUF2786 domain-containing protein [Rhodospirillales bacterium]
MFDGQVSAGKGEARVNTNQINPERLRKVLALVDSDKEGEALAAFQMAKRLLAKGGMSF